MKLDLEKPCWLDNWKVFLLFASISFVLAFGLRCIDLPKWSDPSFMLNGEYILGTHDAYYWLAGAKGVGRAINSPMAGMIRTLGSITGAPYGNIAFWLPAVFAGFCAVAAFGWGMLVAGPWVGLTGAFFATAVPAFYFRTRLSFYDTDIVTLFFPLLISLFLARWLLSGSRLSWNMRSNEDKKFNPTIYDYLLPLLAGGISCYGGLWHGDIRTYGLVAFAIAVLLVFVCGTSPNRATLMRGVFLYSLVAFGGWIGFALSVAAIAAFSNEKVRSHKYFLNVYVFLALCAAVFLIGGAGDNVLTSMIYKFSAYMKPVVSVSDSKAGPVYPGIAQSVIEAQNLGFDILFQRFIGSQALGWAGFSAFAAALVLCPSLIFLTPFAAMTLAASVMGGRFAMFGGLPVGIGLGYVAHFLINRYVRRSPVRLALNFAQAVVFCLLLFSISANLYINVMANPIMSSQHVKALVESSKQMDKNGTIWTWWDWGYASMYYAGINSFADGGNHAGEVLYPLSFVYATPSLLQANQMMKFSAVSNYKPSAVWAELGAQKAQQQIRMLGDKRLDIPVKQKQYIVASWENVKLAYWILYYGSWNIIKGTAFHPSVNGIRQAFNIDFSKGLLSLGRSGLRKISSYDFLTSDGLNRRTFPQNIGPHLLYNQVGKQGFLVDDFTYQSMLFQLLVTDPASPEMKENFKLIYEGFPMVRIFEVL